MQSIHVSEETESSDNDKLLQPKLPLNLSPSCMIAGPADCWGWDLHLSSFGAEVIASSRFGVSSLPVSEAGAPF